ncbi:MAG: GlsB/YeaQ/YmgE family stress response membrane protein [Pseudomonadota bacterium]
MGIIWTILIGFIAGLIAKWLKPGPNPPSGFVLTTLLGIGGAFFFTWLGQQLGFYQMGESAGFIGSVIGAVLVLMIWSALSKRV